MNKKTHICWIYPPHTGWEILVTTRITGLHFEVTGNLNRNLGSPTGVDGTRQELLQEGVRFEATQRGSKNADGPETSRSKGSTVRVMLRCVVLDDVELLG